MVFFKGALAVLGLGASGLRVPSFSGFALELCGSGGLDSRDLVA